MSGGRVVGWSGVGWLGGWSVMAPLWLVLATVLATVLYTVWLAPALAWPN